MVFEAIKLLFQISITILSIIIPLILLGLVCHELSHYGVWKVAGRDPAFNIRSWGVFPRAGCPWAVPADRLAAAAPYIIGLLVIVLFISHWGWVLFFALGLLAPSREDMWTIFYNPTFNVEQPSLIRPKIM